jgi:multiple sugar transport system permease protein
MPLGPAIAVILLSFTDWNFGEPELRWHGLGNCAGLWGDRVFWTSLRNTLIDVGVSVPATVILGLGAALLIEGAARGQGSCRALYFLSVASTLLGMALVWEFMPHPRVGLVNQAIALFGLARQDWLNNPNLSLLALAAIGIWRNLGLAIVSFMAGIQAVPVLLYEALTMDGAGGAWERFRHVTSWCVPDLRYRLEHTNRH